MSILRPRGVRDKDQFPFEDADEANKLFIAAKLVFVLLFFGTSITGGSVVVVAADAMVVVVVVVVVAAAFELSRSAVADDRVIRNSSATNCVFVETSFKSDSMDRTRF